MKNIITFIFTIIFVSMLGGSIAWADNGERHSAVEKSRPATEQDRKDKLKDARDSKRDAVDDNHKEKEREHDGLEKNRVDTKIGGEATEKRERKINTTKEKRENKKELSRERKEVKKERLQEKKEGVKENKEARREKLLEKRSERVAAYAERMSKRLHAAVNRIERLGERVASRIEKFEELGIDTSAAKAHLDISKEMITKARTGIENTGEVIKQALVSENPREAFVEVRRVLKETVKSIKAAHASIVDAVKTLKDSLRDKKGVATGEGSSSTETDGNTGQ